MCEGKEEGGGKGKKGEKEERRQEKQAEGRNMFDSQGNACSTSLATLVVLKEF